MHIKYAQDDYVVYIGMNIERLFPPVHKRYWLLILGLLSRKQAATCSLKIFELYQNMDHTETVVLKGK